MWVAPPPPGLPARTGPDQSQRVLLLHSFVLCGRQAENFFPQNRPYWPYWAFFGQIFVKNGNFFRARRKKLSCFGGPLLNWRVRSDPPAVISNPTLDTGRGSSLVPYPFPKFLIWVTSVCFSSHPYDEHCAALAFAALPPQVARSLPGGGMALRLSGVRNCAAYLSSSQALADYAVLITARTLALWEMSLAPWEMSVVQCKQSSVAPPSGKLDCSAAVHRPPPHLPPFPFFLRIGFCVLHQASF